MYQTTPRRVKRRALTTSNHALAWTLTSLFLAWSALAAAAQAPTPPLSDNEGRTPPSLDARFRQFDNHYATKTTEMKQSIQEALTAIKQAPTAAEIAALKAIVTRLEAQVTRLTAGTTRTEGALTGLTVRIEATERAQAERTSKESGAASPSPPGALQKTDKLEKPVDSADVSFNDALAALHGPKETTEPIRRWLELHPTHPEAAEGYLQLGFYLLNQHQPVMATYYLKHLIAAYPLNLQAKEAQAILSSIPLADSPKSRALPKKTSKPSKTADRKPAAAGLSLKDGGALSKSEDNASTAPAITPPEPSRHEAERLGPPFSTTPSPVAPHATSKNVEGPVSAPRIAPPLTGPPLKPTLPARPHVDKKS